MSDSRLVMIYIMRLWQSIRYCTGTPPFHRYAQSVLSALIKTKHPHQPTNRILFVKKALVAIYPASMDEGNGNGAWYQDARRDENNGLFTTGLKGPYRSYRWDQVSSRPPWELVFTRDLAKSRPRWD